MCADHFNAQKPRRVVSAAAYWTMLAAANGGWIIGTVLYHWLT